MQTGFLTSVAYMLFPKARKSVLGLLACADVLQAVMSCMT